MTFPNNVLLYNAGIVGYLAGHVRGRRLTKVNSGTPPSIGTPDPSYAALASEAVQWATALDAQIETDTQGSPQPLDTQGISVVTAGVGVAIAPTSVGSPTGGQVAQAQLAKARLMEMLSLAAFETRYYAQPSREAPTSEELVTLAKTISGSYLGSGGIAFADIASPGVTAVNNVLIEQAVFDGFIGGLLLLNQGSLQPLSILLATAAAVGLAFEVDTLIPFDPSITVSSSNQSAITPGYASPTTAELGIQTLQVGKTRLLLSIVLAVMEQRSTFSLQQFISGSTPNLTAIEAWAQEQAPIIAAVYTACVGPSSPADAVGVYTVGTPAIVGAPNPVNTGASPIPVGSGVGELWNAGLYNEAYCGFIAANLSERPITATNSGDPFYVALALAAQTFAKEIDLVVAASDVTGADVPSGTQFITFGGDGGALLVTPDTGPVEQGELGKTGTMWAICRGVQHGRPLLGNILDTTASTYAAISESIVALYLEIATVLQVPGAT